MIKILLDTNGQTHEGKGETIYEALSNIPLDYTQIKTKGVFHISDGKKKTEQFLYLKQLRKLFVSRVRRQGYARDFEHLLKESGG